MELKRSFGIRKTRNASGKYAILFNEITVVKTMSVNISIFVILFLPKKFLTNNEIARNEKAFVSTSAFKLELMNNEEGRSARNAKSDF